MPPMARRAAIDISELSEFFDELDDWFKWVMLSFNNDLAKEGRKIAVRMARRDLPGGGGGYARSFQIRSGGRRGDKHVTILRNTHPFASHVELGTEPHEISSPKLMTAYPMLSERGGKEREFGMRYGGAVAKGFKFQHPGARRFLILKRTTDAVRRKWHEIFNRVVERELV